MIYLLLFMVVFLLWNLARIESFTKWLTHNAFGYVPSINVLLHSFFFRFNRFSKEFLFHAWIPICGIIESREFCAKLFFYYCYWCGQIVYKSILKPHLLPATHTYMYHKIVNLCTSLSINYIFPGACIFWYDVS